MYILSLLLLLQGPAPDSLTIEGAVDLARRQRPAFAVSGAEVDEARAALRSAGTIPNPTVSYSHTQSAPGDHLLVDQPLDFLLTRGADRAGARATIAKIQADSAARDAELVAEVSVAFYRALATDRALEAVRAQSTLADSLAMLASRRLEAGDISQFERDQLALEATRTRALLSSARQESQLARSALARLLAWPTVQRLSPLAGALDAGLTLVTTDEADTLSLPLVRSAVADSTAAAATLRSAGLAAVPMPTVQAGVEWNDPSLPGRSLSVIGLAIPLPLWNQNGGKIGEARARARQAAGRVAEARLESAERVRSARITLVESAARGIQARDTIAPAAHALAARAARAYAAGETGVVPVLDALRTERDATLDLIRELLAFQTARAEWNALVESSR